jgi:glycosyltransferase involved in cell wall biosynthesis
MEKVSIIIAAYNAEKFIYECVESCLKQTYENIEVCITDDGSIDGTWNLLVKLYGNDERVKLDKFDKNQGKVAAFNNSFRISTGDYIAIMGADDICVEDRIEKSLIQLKEYDMVVGNLMTFSENGVISSNHMFTQHKINEAREVTFSELLLSPIVFGGTMMSRRILLNDIFPIDCNLAHEDWWIPLYAAYKKNIKYTTDLFIKYRIHDSSSTNSKKVKSYSNWEKYYSRDVCYFDKISSEFKMDEVQKQYVIYNKYKSEMFSDKNILKRIAKFKFINRYEKSFKVKLNYFALMLSPRLGYMIYVLKNYIKSFIYTAKLNKNKISNDKTIYINGGQTKN